MVFLLLNQWTEQREIAENVFQGFDWIRLFFSSANNKSMFSCGNFWKPFFFFFLNFSIFTEAWLFLHLENEFGKRLAVLFLLICYLNFNSLFDVFQEASWYIKCRKLCWKDIRWMIGGDLVFSKNLSVWLIIFNECSPWQRIYINGWWSCNSCCCVLWELYIPSGFITKNNYLTFFHFEFKLGGLWEDGIKVISGAKGLLPNNYFTSFYCHGYSATIWSFDTKFSMDFK